MEEAGEQPKHGGERDRPAALEVTPLNEELGAASISDGESVDGAARPMFGSFATTGLVQLHSSCNWRFACSHTRSG